MLHIPGFLFLTSEKGKLDPDGCSCRNPNEGAWVLKAPMDYSPLVHSTKPSSYPQSPRVSFNEISPVISVTKHLGGEKEGKRGVCISYDKML